MTTLILLATDVVLNLVPAYSTYVAVVRPSPEATKTWLTFWVVHTMFSIAELFLDAVAWWLPAYQVFKVLLVLWLVFFGGAGVIYNGVVQRVLERYEAEIDAGLDRLQLASVAGALHWAKAGLSQLSNAPSWLAAAGAIAGGQVDAAMAAAAAVTTTTTATNADIVDGAVRHPVGPLMPLPAAAVAAAAVSASAAAGAVSGTASVSAEVWSAVGKSSNSSGNPTGPLRSPVNPEEDDDPDYDAPKRNHFEPTVRRR